MEVIENEATNLGPCACSTISASTFSFCISLFAEGLNHYSDHELIFKGDFEICPPGKNPKKDSWWIGDFVPLTVEEQHGTCDLSLFDRIGCCFAGDGMGNFYWAPVDPERKADAAVFFACHDPWGNEKIAESLGEFLSWPRVATMKR